MGFWKTLFQVCTGTDVYVRLLECRLLKALLHLIALTLLLSLVLAWGHSCQEAAEIRDLSGRLFYETGRLLFFPDTGVRTEKNADKRQSYRLNDQLRFDYYPGQTLTESAVKDWNTPYGLIVMDNGFVFWAENYAEGGKGKYLAAPFLLVQNPMQAETVRTGLSGKMLYDFLKSNLEHRKGQRIHFLLPELDAKVVGDYLVSCLGVMIFFGALVSILVICLFTIVFFSLMQLLLNAGMPKRLSYPRLLVLVIYTTFPALVIASLYSFLMIRQISPQSVFFAIFFVFYLIVFRKIRLFLNPPEDRVDDDEL